MKKSILLSIALLLASLTFAQKGKSGAYYTYSSECLGTELDGSETIKSWGKGRNYIDAVEQAKKNAVRDVIFKGIQDGSTDCSRTALILDPHVQKRNEEYFFRFFADGGKYQDFVSLKDERILDKIDRDKKKGEEQVTQAVIVRINRFELKQQLIDDGMIPGRKSVAAVETSYVQSNVETKTSNNSEVKSDSEHGSESSNLYRGGGDPLKGLNTAEAKKDMNMGKYYALIIGIDNYSKAWTPLNNAVNDAKAVEALLKEKYRFDHFSTLYNDQATREKIINEMVYLVDNVKEDDNVLIYYSGHGEYNQSLDKGYWVPVDATSASVAKYISNSDIQTFLGGIKSQHTLLISDACFSGDIFRGKTISVPFENSDKYYEKVHSLKSRQAITSGGIEPVMDGGKDGHSVFAYYLLNLLKNNNAKYYDASQLYDGIKIPVTNNSEQSPKLNPIKNSGDEGGQFIFIKK